MSSKNKKQKILVIHNYYQISGGEDTVVANEKKLLEDHGHEIILYSRNNSELKEMSKIQKLALPIITVFNPRTYREVRKVIKSENVDIVHVHNTLNLVSPAVYYAALSCGVPVVQTIHNFRLLCPGATFYRDGHICEDCVEHGLGCAVKYSCYRGSSWQTLACVINTKIHRMTGIYGKINYIALTEFNREKLLTLKQIKSERVFIKPNFVISDIDCTFIEKRKSRYIYVGRIDKLKGIDILLKAWKQLDRKDLQLLICGTGPMEEWCREFIKENRLSNVEMLGFVLNTEAKKLIRNSEALILPTQCYEGFPMTILEAFSVGTSVICSDLGNAGSVVDEGLTGWKFRADSPEALINAIEKNESRDEGMSSRIMKEYKEKYSMDANYLKLKEIYDLVVTSKRAGGYYAVIPKYHEDGLLFVERRVAA